MHEPLGSLSAYSHGYSGAKLTDYKRQKPFASKMAKLLEDLGYAEAIRARDADRVMEISKVYVDKWLEFDPAFPGLHNFFQAPYWLNRLTGGLVRHKRFEEAKSYLDIYFGREWDRLFFPNKGSLNKTLRKRHERMEKLVSEAKDAQQAAPSP